MLTPTGDSFVWRAVEGEGLSQGGNSSEAGKQKRSTARHQGNALLLWINEIMTHPFILHFISIL